jgi:hypothetical protein
VKRLPGLRLLIWAGFTLGGAGLLGCNPAITQFLNSWSPTNPTQEPDDSFALLIQQLEETMPRASTEAYKNPSQADERSFQDMVIGIERNDLTGTTQSASSYHYELLWLSDPRDSNAESYVLRERQPIDRGWGLYFFRLQDFNEIIVEVPHPLADENTPQVALDLYRALHAQALLVAGAHRNANADGSADAAHARESIFQTVHTTIFKLREESAHQMIVLQIHGYDPEEHPKAPQVVIGYNWKTDPEKDLLLSRIVSALRTNQITVGACNEKTYPGLCGTTNMQRQAMKDGMFFHMELSPELRHNDRAFILALKQALVPENS